MLKAVSSTLVMRPLAFGDLRKGFPAILSALSPVGAIPEPPRRNTNAASPPRLAEAKAAEATPAPEKKNPRDPVEEMTAPTALLAPTAPAPRTPTAARTPTAPLWSLPPPAKVIDLYVFVSAARVFLLIGVLFCDLVLTVCPGCWQSCGPDRRLIIFSSLRT